MELVEGATYLEGIVDGEQSRHGCSRFVDDRGVDFDRGVCDE